MTLFLKFWFGWLKTIEPVAEVKSYRAIPHRHSA